MLGPQGAEAAGIGEDLVCPCSVCLERGRNERLGRAQLSLTIHIRFLQLRSGELSAPTLAGDICRSRASGRQ